MESTDPMMVGRCYVAALILGKGVIPFRPNLGRRRSTALPMGTRSADGLVRAVLNPQRADKLSALRSLGLLGPTNYDA
jgi:hypothetical protein